MQNLLPRFIQEQYRQNKFSGQFEAWTIFTDISGFTRMTEELMEVGQEGAEILSFILNQIFGPAVHAIHARNGFISAFAGDAMVVIFPTQNSESPQTGLEQALHCAIEISHIFKKYRFERTRFGQFEIQVKIGVASGTVEWGIAGNNLKAYYFRGPALDACVRAQEYAPQGDIVFDAALAEQTAQTTILQPLESDNTFYRLITMNVPPKTDIPADNRTYTTDKIIASHFFPGSLIEQRQTGEFRNVATMFISHQGANGAELDRYIDLLLEKISYYGGYFNRIVFGDKTDYSLCIFGAPVAYENSVQRALEFILELRDELTEILPDLQLRAGLTYGAVYAGFIGCPDRCEYTVHGDIVNLAARLMTGARFGEIRVSQEVHKLAKNLYEIHLLGNMNFKGKSIKVPVYFLWRKKKQSLQNFSGAFIERRQEFNIAEDFLQFSQEKPVSKLLYIYGDPGVGKSRFASELRRRHCNWNWLRLPCDGILRKPLNPFHTFFMRFFKQFPEYSDEQNKNYFEKHYQQLLIDPLQKANISPSVRESLLHELQRLHSLLAGFLGVHYEGSLFERLEPEARRENTFEALRVAFRALSLNSTLALELEDLHLIDAESRKALRTIFQNDPQTHILMVATGRPFLDGRRPKLPLDIPYSQIVLDPFTREDVANFAQNYLQGKISDELLEHLINQTAGNAFFLEQTLLYCRQENIILKKGDVWFPATTATSLPNSINDLLLTRIDRMPESTRKVLQTAAVIGRQFRIPLFLEVLQKNNPEIPKDDIPGLLKKLEDENIWSALSDTEYSFNNTLLLETIYRMQLKERLRTLHALIAQTLEKQFQNSPRIFTELGYHYEQADLPEKAKEYLRKAGDHAKETHQHEPAIELYSRLLPLLFDEFKIDAASENTDLSLIKPLIAEKFDALTEGLSALYDRGDVLSNIGRRDEAIKDYKIALRLAEFIKNDEQITRGYVRLGWHHYLSGDSEQAMGFFTRAETICEELQAKKRLAMVVSNMGKIHERRGDYEKAQFCYNRQLKLSEELNDKHGLGGAIGNLGNINYYRGKFSRALKLFEQRLRICRELDDQSGIAAALNNIGGVFHMQKDFQAARNRLNQALQIYEKLGNKQQISQILGNLGRCHFELNELDRALEYYKQKLKLSESLQNKSDIADATMYLGRMRAKEGKYDAALKLYEKSFKLHEDVGDRSSSAYTLGFMGILLQQTGNFARAMGCYEIKLSFEEYLGNKHEILFAIEHMGDLHYDKTEYNEALTYYDRALTLDFQKAENKPNQFEILFAKARTLFALQRNAESKITLREALQSLAEGRSEQAPFHSRLLDACLDHADGRSQPLHNLLQETRREADRADIYYEIWKWGGDLQAGREAQTLFRKLYGEHPRYLYQQKLEELEKSRG